MTTDGSLRRLLDDSAADDAVRRRSGRGAARARCGSDATLVGVLADLRDARAEVRIELTEPNPAGVIVEVHIGGVAMRSGTQLHLIRLDAIRSVRRSPGVVSRTIRLDGEGTTDTALSWGSFVGSRLEPDDELMVRLASRSIEGVLLATSTQVLQLRTNDGGVDYVALDAVEVISLRVPGSIRHDATNSSTSSRITRITRPNR